VVYYCGDRLHAGLAIARQGHHPSGYFSSLKALLDWFVEKHLRARISWQRRSGVMIPLTWCSRCLAAPESDGIFVKKFLRASRRIFQKMRLLACSFAP